MHRRSRRVPALSRPARSFPSATAPAVRLRDPRRRAAPPARPRASRRWSPPSGLLAFGLALTAAALAPAPVAAQSDAEAVRATLVAMWDAIENEDMERYATYIHDDFTSFGETDTYLNEGKAQEIAGVRGWTSRSANIRTEMHQPEVTVRGDVAWITYYWTDEATSKLTGERETSRGKSTRIFVREGGRWLCIHGHYTLVE